MVTQTDLNNRVSYLTERLVELNNNLAFFEQSKEAYAIELRERQRFLANVVSSLSSYDISLGILTNEQLLYTIELGICACQTCE